MGLKFGKILQKSGELAALQYQSVTDTHTQQTQTDRHTTTVYTALSVAW